MSKVEIEIVSNGYIYKDSHNENAVMYTTEELFDRLLAYFEGRTEYFTDESYGRVEIHRERTEAKQ